ncbi:serine/threonine-protein kinase [Cryptosporangium aurantiacum]|uniref:non-specific serine/threonine protein kinase n=1 Tax=Cryptosporangium aurantiacum TaxID=134849 RepID=A0A1M7MVR6_9ACTN|nr:serine/threonine-protein kinase [Cryptosporangium aurantiacum]SHM95268.1 Serine/threonine protein kinase [Cryptosporangium aurantiacum]
MADTQQTVLAGRYRLVDQLGRGGMGTVWRAHDELLDRDVAVKEVLLPPGVDDETRNDLLERTKREARAAARLSHPNVVTVFDVVEVEGRPWIVMELVKARGLNQIVRDEGPLPPERVASIGVQLLNALGVAHASGIFHRDVKPSNVLVADNGRVVLADFGIASVQGDPAMTRSGLILGSPSYIAPERARGLPAGPASDLWAVGATLYTAVEGRPPYDRDGIVPILTAAAMEDPDPFRLAGPLEPVLTALLLREPEKRPSVEDARLALRQISLAALPPAPERPRRRSMSATAVLPATDSAAPVSPAAKPVSPTAKPVSPAAEPVSPAAEPVSPAAAGAASVAAEAAAPTSPSAAAATPAQRTPLEEASSISPPAAAEDVRPDSPAVVGFGSEPAVKAPRRASIPLVDDVPAAPAAAGTAAPGRGRTIGVVAAVIVVLLVVAGLAFALSNRSDDQDGATPAPSSAAPSAASPSPGSTAGSSSPSAAASSPSATTQVTAIPAGWREYTSPTGFKIGVPNGWTATQSGDGIRINGNNGIFLLIQESDTPKQDAKADWEAQESERRGGLPGYQRISIDSVQYRNYSTAADWQFYLDRGQGQIHVLNRGFVTSRTQAYGFWFEAPQSKWGEAQKYFQTFANTFQPAPGS